jgi:plastocyanin
LNAIHRSKRLAGLLIGVCCLPDPSFAGGIKGKVVFAGAAPASQKIPVTIDQYLCGTEKDDETLLLSARKEIRNAVVWLENPPAKAASPPPADKVEVDQKACAFVPRIVLVPAGGTVDFLNSDRLLHNIHATPKDNVAFNRTQPKSRTIPVTFAKPEIIHIGCDLHSWMTAWVVVTAHPFYAITGADGQFVFDDLPPGQYKLHVWHESLGSVPATAAVSDGLQDAQVIVEMRAR